VANNARCQQGYFDVAGTICLDGQMMLPVAVCPPGIREVNRRLGMQCAGQTHDHLIFFCSRVLAPGSSFCVGNRNAMGMGARHVKCTGLK